MRLSLWPIPGPRLRPLFRSVAGETHSAQRRLLAHFRQQVEHCSRVGRNLDGDPDAGNVARELRAAHELLRDALERFLDGFLSANRLQQQFREQIGLGRSAALQIRQVQFKLGWLNPANGLRQDVC